MTYREAPDEPTYYVVYTYMGRGPNTGLVRGPSPLAWTASATTLPAAVDIGGVSSDARLAAFLNRRGRQPIDKGHLKLLWWARLSDVDVHYAHQSGIVVLD